jgi:hypothetical protein
MSSQTDNITLEKIFGRDLLLRVQIIGDNPDIKGITTNDQKVETMKPPIEYLQNKKNDGGNQLFNGGSKQKRANKSKRVKSSSNKSRKAGRRCKK